ncbi:MAG: sulfatase [Phycisphaerae bacterium]|nr:sulfatase [Phycisphaerae bacterium]
MRRLPLARALRLCLVVFSASPAFAPAASSKGTPPSSATVPARRVNVLLITADDLYWKTPASFGGRLLDLTPNIDRLAREGMRFMHAHVTIAVCQPSRQVLMTGRYSHRNGGEGFEPIHLDVPTLQERLHAAGYLLGCFGKLSHLAPASKYHWDSACDQSQLGIGRDPEKYHQAVKSLLDRARAENKPFFIMANSHDPHRPFSGSERERMGFGTRLAGVPAPSRRYQPDEIWVPGFLPNLPDIREEIAEYNSSSRRCDDTVGAVLRALRESGYEDSTLVIFLSDNGISVPFSKANCYLNSTRTPWIVRWPGQVKPGTVDDLHLISGIDFMPTILEATIGTDVPGMDGRSFLPLLRGNTQAGREYCFTQFHQTSARNRYPMRCVQSRDFGYIFNFWADGKTVYRSEPQTGLTFNAMQAAAVGNPAIAARVHMLQYRVREEFYDLKNDPDALLNLAGNDQYTRRIEEFRGILLDWMKRTNDPAAAAFENRNSEAAIAAFMNQERAKTQPATEDRHP